MIIILLFAVISFLLNKGGMTKILSYLLLPNKRCSQRNSSPHHSQLSKNMKSYFCQFLAICSELSSLRHNLILQRLDYRPAHLLLFLHHQHEQVLFHIFQLTLNPELLTQDSTLYLQHSDLHYSLFHHVKMF